MKYPLPTALLCWLLLFAAAFAQDQGQPAEATFVGAEACAGCHATQTKSWTQSHHALAMQKATPATVLGDFNNATLTHHGVTTTFSRNGDTFMVRTEGPDGALHDYEIAYTFAVYPLQQYLIAFPGGRYQALGIAWDSRPKDQGGQRWLHLYPDETLPAGDRLHWTGRDQTWNYQCADCHSTDLKKNYDLATNTYATTWTDVDVSCEACHGRARATLLGHRRTRPVRRRPKPPGDPRWAYDIAQADRQGVWEMNPETGIARRTEPLGLAELDVCARMPFAPQGDRQGSRAGRAPFLDSYLPALLEPGLYHADGQIDGEVYEYGSFLQSRMYHAGVTCSNCHEPHSLDVARRRQCALRAMPSCPPSSMSPRTPITSRGAPARNAPTATCRRRPICSSTRAAITASACRARTCRSRSGRRTPATHAMPTRTRNGPRKVAGWFPTAGRPQPHFGPALNAGRTGAADAERRLDAFDRRREPAGDRTGQRAGAARAARQPGLRGGDRGGDHRS